MTVGLESKTPGTWLKGANCRFPEELQRRNSAPTATDADTLDIRQIDQMLLCSSPCEKKKLVGSVLDTIHREEKEQPCVDIIRASQQHRI